MTSKRRLRRRSCESKVQHLSEAAAVRAARAVQAKSQGAPVRAYKCPHCGKWHIGTPDSRRLQALRSKQEDR